MTESWVRATFGGCALAIVALMASACSQDADQLPDQYVFGGDRPTDLQVSPLYDHGTPAPLVVVLHGYGGSGLLQTRLLGMNTLLEEVPMLLAAPDGTLNEKGDTFWNIDGAFGPEVDDLGYLSGLIDEIGSVWNVDQKRIYLIGYSNGAFMSYRLACDRSATIAAIVPIAGAALLGNCVPSEVVSIAHVHGTEDDTVLFEGGITSEEFGELTYPGAIESLELWATYNECSTARTVQPERIDVDRSLEGAETQVERFDDCPAGVDVELWMVEGGGHILVPANGTARLLWRWLDDHAKP